MSEPTAPERRPAMSGSPAARYLFMALLGLVVGAVATVMLLRALEARRDPYPEAVMQVMRAHMSGLKRNVMANRCAVTDTLPHLQTLRRLADDIEPAFPGFRDEPSFGKHASDLRAAVDAGLASPPLDCPGLQATMAKIGDTCSNCHNEFNK